jgi:uncharacterized protein YcfJ
MFKTTAIATAIAVLGVSATAQAGWHDYRDDSVDYADVLSTQPIYRDVRIAQPRQECRQEQVVYNQGGYVNARNDEGVGALLGAVVGGVVGNRFGHGGGRVATTAVGAVIGASAGASIGRNNGGGGYYQQPEVGYQQVCQQVEDYGYQRQVDGYDVTYRYHGRDYRTRLPYDPGARLAVNVNVSPAGY